MEGSVAAVQPSPAKTGPRGKMLWRNAFRSPGRRQQSAEQRRVNRTGTCPNCNASELPATINADFARQVARIRDGDVKVAPRMSNLITLREATKTQAFDFAGWYNSCSFSPGIWLQGGNDGAVVTGYRSVDCLLRGERRERGSDCLHFRVARFYRRPNNPPAQHSAQLGPGDLPHLLHGQRQCERLLDLHG